MLTVLNWIVQFIVGIAVMTFLFLGGLIVGAIGTILGIVTTGATVILVITLLISELFASNSK
jgi:hypothetical protein